MARWKSGLFPLEVLAIRVNWDTQRMSPSISDTLDFHIFVESSVASNKRRVRLRRESDILAAYKTGGNGRLTFSSR